MSTTTLVVNAPAPRRRWRSALWVLLVLGVLALWTAFSLIDAIDAAPVDVRIGGAPWVADLDLATLPPLHKVALALGIAVVLMVALVVALLAVIPIVLLAVALPLLIVGALAALLLSPLLLLAWLLWRALRPSGPRSTTMAA